MIAFYSLVEPLSIITIIRRKVLSSLKKIFFKAIRFILLSFLFTFSRRHIIFFKPGCECSERGDGSTKAGSESKRESATWELRIESRWRRSRLSTVSWAGEGAGDEGSWWTWGSCSEQSRSGRGPRSACRSTWNPAKLWTLKNRNWSFIFWRFLFYF